MTRMVWIRADQPFLDGDAADLEKAPFGLKE